MIAKCETSQGTIVAHFKSYRTLLDPPKHPVLVSITWLGEHAMLKGIRVKDPQIKTTSKEPLLTQTPPKNHPLVLDAESLGLKWGLVEGRLLEETLSMGRQSGEIAAQDLSGHTDISSGVLAKVDAQKTRISKVGEPSVGDYLQVCHSFELYIQFMTCVYANFCEMLRKAISFAQRNQDSNTFDVQRHFDLVSPDGQVSESLNMRPLTR